jgi:hypothetical protein
VAEKSVNDSIHEKLIEHAVDLRKVDGGRRRLVEKRIDTLAADLKALMIKIDPFGTERSDARERRLKKLDEESARLIAEAYGEISSGMQKDLKRVARVESEAVVKTIREELP